MPLKLRRCSECGVDISDRPAGTKTHNQSCRQKRARRLAAAKKKAGSQSKFDPAVQDMAAATRGEVNDAIHEVAVEEIRPLVREAMTEEVLNSIQSMVTLAPVAIAVLTEQMASSDEVIAQRAATLFLKYTMGNPSVAPPPTEKAPAPMSVVFNIPRPGDPTDTTPPEPAPQELNGTIELRQCTDCSEHKTEQEFVGASSRCQACFDALHETLAARFAEPDPSRPE